MGSTLAPICPPCTELRMKWLDSAPSQVLPTFGIAYGSGANYDISAAGLRDRGRSRHQQWSALVREQMAGVAASCRANNHSATAMPALPTVVQLDLPSLEEAA